MKRFLAHNEPPPETVNASFGAIFDSSGKLLIVESIAGGGPDLPRNGNGQLELPGGGRDNHECVYATARREVKEETGLDIGKGEPEITVSALSRSAEKAAYIGLVIVQYSGAIPVNLSFTTRESAALHLVDPEEFLTLPTIEEDPFASRLTYRLHRVFVACALGILSGKIESSIPADFTFGPFENEYLQTMLGQYYPSVVAG